MTEPYPEAEIEHSLAQEPAGVAVGEENPPAGFWGDADDPTRPAGHEPPQVSAGDANADPAGPR